MRLNKHISTHESLPNSFEQFGINIVFGLTDNINKVSDSILGDLVLVECVGIESSLKEKEKLFELVFNILISIKLLYSFVFMLCQVFLKLNHKGREILHRLFHNNSNDRNDLSHLHLVIVLKELSFEGVNEIVEQNMCNLNFVTGKSDGKLLEVCHSQFFLILEES